MKVLEKNFAQNLFSYICRLKARSFTKIGLQGYFSMISLAFMIVTCTIFQNSSEWLLQEIKVYNCVCLFNWIYRSLFHCTKYAKMRVFCDLYIHLAYFKKIQGINLNFSILQDITVYPWVVSTYYHQEFFLVTQ